MESINTLYIITIVVVGFGFIPLLGALLPRDLEDDD